MKQMTKQELIDLIKEKQESAGASAYNMNYEHSKKGQEYWSNEELRKYYHLGGELDTYHDIVALLESTEIVNEPKEKPLDTLCQSCVKVADCGGADDNVKDCIGYVSKKEITNVDNLYYDTDKEQWCEKKETQSNLLKQILKELKYIRSKV